MDPLGTGSEGRLRHLIGLLVVPLALLVLSTACSSSSGGGGGSSGAAKEGGVLRIGTSEGTDSPNPFVGFNQDDYSTSDVHLSEPARVRHDIRPLRLRPQLRDEVGGVRRRADLDVPHGSGREVVRRAAADRRGRRVDLQHDLEVRQRPDGSLGGQRDVPEEHQGHRPQHGRLTYTKPSGTALFDLGLTPDPAPQVWQQYATGDGKALKTFANEPEDGQPLVGGARSSSPSTARTTSRCSSGTPTTTARKPHHRRIRAPVLPTARTPMITALKTGQLDAIEGVPPTSVDTLKAAGIHVYEGPALVPPRLHHQRRSRTSQSTSRAARPEGQRGVRVRDRPQTRSSRRHGSDIACPGCEHRARGQRDRRHRLARPERPAAAVRHRTRRTRSWTRWGTEGLGRHPGRRRATRCPTP